MSCIIIKKDHRQASLLMEYLREKGFGTATIMEPLLPDIRREMLKTAYRYAVIDAALDGADGFELARTVQKLSPRIHCVLCIDPAEFKLDYLMRFNISGYLDKDHSLKDLLQCFELINEGYRFTSEAIRKKLSQIEDLTEDDFSGDARLTKQEKKILQLLMSGKNTSDIAQELFLSSNTINNHKTNIRKKLNLASNRQLIFYAMHHSKMFRA